MTEKKEVDRWLIPGPDVIRKYSSYARFHRVYEYADNSWGCSCAEWRDNKKICEHMKKVENIRKTITYIRDEEYQRAKDCEHSHELPLRELEGVDLSKKSIYFASSEPFKEVSIESKATLQLTFVSYEQIRYKTRRESTYSAFGAGPSHKDYRWLIKISTIREGDFVILLDLIPYVKLKGSNTFLWYYTPTQKIEQEFDEIVAEFKKWIKTGGLLNKKINDRLFTFKEEQKGLVRRHLY